MDKNIRYVRDKRVAPLLNDMVMHLLTTTPADPLDTLIQYLEKRESINQHRSPAAATTSTSGAATVKTHQQQQSSSSAQDATSNKPPLVPTPPVEGEASSSSPKRGCGGVTTTAAAAARPMSRQREELGRTRPSSSLSQPRPAVDDVTKILQTLQEEEHKFRTALLAERNNRSLSSDEVGAVTALLAQSEELLTVLNESSGAHMSIQVGLDVVHCGMNARDHLSCEAFRLLHELDRNERDARAVFSSSLVMGNAYRYTDSTNPKEIVRQQQMEDTDEIRGLLAAAASNHEELRSLFEQCEGMQMDLDSRMNGGKLGLGAQMCLQGISDDVSTTTKALMNNLTTVLASEGAAEVIRGGIDSSQQGSSSGSGVVDLSKLQLTKQFDILLSEYTNNERQMLTILEAAAKSSNKSGGNRLTTSSSASPSPGEGGEMGENADTLGVKAAKEALEVAREAQHCNQELCEDQPKNYQEAVQALQTCSDAIHRKLHVLLRSANALEIKTGTERIAGLMELIRKNETEMNHTLLQLKFDRCEVDVVSEALKTQKELEGLLRDVEGLEVAIAHDAATTTSAASA